MPPRESTADEIEVDLDALTAEFDEMVARMQDASCARNAAAFFEMTPEQLGEAAAAAHREPAE